MDVQLFDIALKLRHPIATSKGPITQRDGIALFIRDGTHHGWGEAMCLPNWPESNLTATRQALEGWAQKPHPQKLPTERFAKGAVELALCNLEAQRQNKTLAQILADRNTATTQVHLNALVSSPAEAAKAVANGYNTVKLKVGVSDLADLSDDVALVAEVRSAIGSNVALRLDANGAWTPTQAHKAIELLTPYNIEYIEEPTSGLANLSQLAENSTIPIAADESLHEVLLPHPKTALPIPVLVVKPMALGGPRTTHSLACNWIRQGHKVVISNYLDSAIGQHAAVSVAAALPVPQQVHGAVTPALFINDLAKLPAISRGRCQLPAHSPTPTPNSLLANA